MTMLLNKLWTTAAPCCTLILGGGVIRGIGIPGGCGIPGGSCFGDRSELEELSCPAKDGVVPNLGVEIGRSCDSESLFLFFASGPSEELLARLRSGATGKSISLG